MKNELGGSATQQELRSWWGHNGMNRETGEVKPPVNSNPVHIAAYATYIWSVFENVQPVVSSKYIICTRFTILQFSMEIFVLFKYWEPNLFIHIEHTVRNIYFSTFDTKY